MDQVSDSRQAGAFSHMTITAAMTDAARLAFRAWFGQSKFDDMLISLPEVDDLDQLSKSIFSSMIFCSPDSIKNDFRRSLIK